MCCMLEIGASSRIGHASPSACLSHQSHDFILIGPYASFLSIFIYEYLISLNIPSPEFDVFIISICSYSRLITSSSPDYQSFRNKPMEQESLETKVTELKITVDQQSNRLTQVLGLLEEMKHQHL